MKTVLKLITALAAIAGAIYAISTYGDQIVAWAKKIREKLPVFECDCEDCEDCECDEECCCCNEEAAEEAAEEAEEAAEATEEAAEAVTEQDFEN